MIKWPPLASLVNGLFLVAGSALLFAGTRSVYWGNVSLAVPALTSALVFLLAATVDRFETLKGLGIEAKTRQLTQKLDEAEQSLTRMRELAELSGSALITLNSQIGRWNAVPTPEDSYQLAQKVVGILEALGSSSIVIRKSLEPWLRVFIFDLSRSILRPIDKALSDRQNELRRKQMASEASLSADEQSQLTYELNAIRDFQEQRLSRTHVMATADYPATIFRLIEDAPLANDSLKQEVKERAQCYSEDISLLIRDMRLRDPARWFKEVNADRLM